MSLACTSYGSGPSFLFLHGLFGSGENLRGLGRAFEDRFTTVYVDLPNHGDSSHTESAGYDRMSSGVAELIESHRYAPVVVAGHSMGGKVAMRLALDRPDLVRALIVLDMAPRPYDPSHQAIIDAMLGLPMEEVTSRAEADRLLADAIPTKAVRSFLLKNLVKEGETYRWRLNLPLLKRDYASILGWEGAGSFEGPALFLGGSESKYLKPERDEQLVNGYFPRAEIKMIAGAGHWIHADYPEVVKSHLTDFLARLHLGEGA